ncbi:dethiobiotin synthase [Neptuniibacter caesariensis]|uniref:ATP-dependent dethiobiotin synthetase BioD n=1 Tax=Neptuniibacter caesariensis TaxID=207954 RepID=A0A7U8GS91_NEPCE|nr:dethiobiotin synthase [Neptuniibacter caesariensis]EAR60835.1 dethiobiotin synthase [Oceanospirillum sp. MED92] [Neptuniibacter caesariensis]
MAKRTFFIAGTDTDAGKTVVSAGLLAAANKKGWSSMGLKPIAAGCERTDEGLRNSDALILQEAASIKLHYDQVNPVTFEPPIAPHIAAIHEKRMLSADRIAALCKGALMQPADFAVVEGAGGWRVPLNQRETVAHIPKQLNIPVIMVVGMKLGCINHALLTAEAIARDGLQVAGWVANRVDPQMDCYDENVDTINSMLRAPLLGEIPFLEEPTAENAAQYINLDQLSM